MQENTVNLMKLCGSNIYCAIRFLKENCIIIHYLINIVINSNNILQFDIRFANLFNDI